MEKKLGRIKDYDKTLPVLELYTAVQSEGSRAGYPTIVVRTTGCTHRCFFRDGGWCDCLRGLHGTRLAQDPHSIPTSPSWHEGL